MIVDISTQVFDAIKQRELAGKIYPVVALSESATPPTPYIVYQRTGADFGYTKNFFDGSIKHYYTIGAYSDTFNKTVELAKDIVDGMLALAYTTPEGSAVTFKSIQVTDISEDFLDGIFYQIIQFEINTIQII